MQRRPALTVSLVHAGTALHQEGHHLHAAVYAGLQDASTTQVLEFLQTLQKELHDRLNCCSVAILLLEAVVQPSGGETPDLMEGCDSICIGTVDDLHTFLWLRFAIFSVLEHQLSLLRVPAGTGSQELCSPVKSDPFPKHRHLHQSLTHHREVGVIWVTFHRLVQWKRRIP